MSTMTATEPTSTTRTPKRRGERDTARDTLDWFHKTIEGRIPNGPGKHRLNPYAQFSYTVVEGK